MQLHFSAEELSLLANILLKESRILQSGMEGQAEVDPATRRKARLYAEMVDRVLARDLQLGFDELQELADLLSREKMALQGEIDRSQDPAQKADWQNKMKLLERVLERVNEASVML